MFRLDSLAANPFGSKKTTETSGQVAFAHDNNRSKNETSGQMAALFGSGNVSGVPAGNTLCMA